MGSFTLQEITMTVAPRASHVESQTGWLKYLAALAMSH